MNKIDPYQDIYYYPSHMNKLTSLIAEHEGCELDPYQDTKSVWTVGYGHNCQDKSISQDIADRLLQDDVREAIHDCRSFTWFDALNEVRAAVIVNMVFNMGLTRFRGFIKTIGYLELGGFGLASEEMLDSKWARKDVSHDRSGTLSRMMATGEWQ